MKYNYDFKDAIKLTNEQLMEEFKKLRITGDKKIRDNIIRATILLVPSTIDKYFSYSPYELEDLVSIGTIGLIHAIDRYDINKDIKFSTYATRCIIGKIYNYNRKSKRHLNLVHLDDVAYQADGDEAKTYMDYIADKENHVENLNDKLDDKIAINKILTLIKNLPENQQKILLTKYFNGKKTLSDEAVANIYGRTKQNISSVKIRAINKLKNNIESV